MKTKIVTSAPCALIAFALLGCSGHASTAPVVARPVTPSSDLNTFGESKDAGASNAERARAANYGSPAAADSTSTAAPK